MNNSTSGTGVSWHFVQRAVERLGCPESEAESIGHDLIWALENERWDIIQFVARVARDGRRVFRFQHAATGRFWYALIDTQTLRCITVLRPGFRVPREGKKSITLKEIDL